MSREVGLSSRTRFLGALAATVAVGVTGLALVGVRDLLGSSPQHRPSISPTSSYELDWQRRGATQFHRVQIAPDGSGCEPLHSSETLYRACVLAVNLDPAVIAGEAFGQINIAPTPSLEALIWRAMLSDDPTVCNRGGLEGSVLEVCTDAFRAGQRVASDQGVTVRIERPKELSSPAP